MKKITALLLVISIILLCACSKNGGTSEETTTSKEEATTLPDYVTEWGSDLLPAEFPAPPKNTYDVTVYDIPATDKLSGACYDITRLIFTCPENDFYNFTNKLAGKGFFGGMKNITNGTLYSNGFAGGWKNDEYLFVIVESEYEDNGDLKLCLDIIKNVSAFPEALKEYFPEFAFPARTGGTYLGYNSEEDQTNTFNGNFEHMYWQWHFRFDNAFIGVSMNDFNNYIDALEEAGFNGDMSSGKVDGCTVINADIFKDDLAILLTYNQILRRLDIVYTNHAEYFFGETE